MIEISRGRLIRPPSRLLPSVPPPNIVQGKVITQFQSFGNGSAPSCDIPQQPLVLPPRGFETAYRGNQGQAQSAMHAPSFAVRFHVPVHPLSRLIHTPLHHIMDGSLVHSHCSMKGKG